MYVYDSPTVPSPRTTARPVRLKHARVTGDPTGQVVGGYLAFTWAVNVNVSVLAWAAERALCAVEPKTATAPAAVESAIAAMSDMLRPGDAVTIVKLGRTSSRYIGCSPTLGLQRRCDS